MSNKVVPIVAGVVLASVAVVGLVALLFFTGAIENLAFWAQRQILAQSVKGGPEVVLEVDADAVRQRAYDLLRPEIVSQLRGARLSFNARPTDAGIRIATSADNRQAVMDKLREKLGASADIKVVDDGAVLVSFTEAELKQRIARAAEDSRDLLTQRLSDVGMKVVVSVQPLETSPRLLVQMARSEDPKRLVALAMKPGELAFRLIDDTVSVRQASASAPPPNAEILYSRPEQGRQPYVVDKRALISGGDLVDAQPGFDSRTNEPIVSFRFSAAGTRKFAQATGENVGRAMAVVVDGEVLAAPVIREPITGGSGQISGSFTLQSANELASVLRHGELPARFKLIEERAAKAQ